MTNKAPVDLEQEVNCTLIHFNDVYNIEGQTKEPIGGATRFATAIKQYSDLNPLVLFSGDCFSPSPLSSVTKGEHMVPVLNSLGTTAALFGNHEFDFGLDNLASLVKQTTFPWLMSNVWDKETGRPLGDGLRTHVVESHGKRIGFMGLVESEWLETLSTIDRSSIEYQDFVKVGNELAKILRSQEKCDIVIALTHMRFPNDSRLAENAIGIDLILGGHDHVYDLKYINGIPVLKSGTDFRDFSVITVTWPKHEKPRMAIERISVTSDYKEDIELKEELEKYTKQLDSKMSDVLAEFHVDLDGRFESVRTMETNLGNFIADIMVAATNADCALLHSGTLRSDRIHPSGPFTRRDLFTILPMMDFLVVIKVRGSQLVEALENGVSKYPKLEGRFPQVGGLRYAFDPSKPPGTRVDPQFIMIGDEYLDLDSMYRVVTKKYIALGHDGYTALANCEIIVDESLGLNIAVQNHFHAIELVKGQTKAQGHSSRHHQSLVTMSRRHSLFRSSSSGSQLESGSLSQSPVQNHLERRLWGYYEDVERKSCQLTPRIEGRIVVITKDEILQELMEQRTRWEVERAVSDNNGYFNPPEYLQSGDQ